MKLTIICCAKLVPNDPMTSAQIDLKANASNTINITPANWLKISILTSFDCCKPLLASEVQVGSKDEINVDKVATGII